MREAKEMAEIAKKKAEVSRKLDAAKRKLETQQKMLEGRARAGQETGIKSIDVKYAANEVKRLQQELSKLH